MDSGSDSLIPLYLGCFSLLFVIALTVGIYLFAANRKATSAVTTKPSRLRIVHSPLGYSDAINRLVQVAPTQGYKVEDVTSDGSRVILGSNITFFSYGFFYPVYFSVEPSGTLVEIGIVSRAFQWGPVVTFNHDKITTMIGNALMPYIPTQYPLQAPPQFSPYPPYPNQPPPNATMPMPPPTPQYPPYSPPPVQPPPQSPPYTPGNPNIPG